DDSTPTGGASRTAALAWYKFVSQFVDELPVEEFPELPRLGGRDGSIKAKPISPGRVSADKPGENSAERPEENRRRYEPSATADSEERYRSSDSSPDSPENVDPELTPDTRSSDSEPAPVFRRSPAPAPAPAPVFSGSPPPAPAAPAPIPPPPAAAPIPLPPKPAPPPPAPAPEPPQPRTLDN
ncbi:MAG: penicillin-binding protein, partial [Phormidesmis sp.]